MTNNIAPLIINQIPEYLRGDSNLFMEFLRTYYEYAQLRNKSNGIVNYLKEDIDIDKTMDPYITKFYSVYGEYVPSETALDRRNLIKLLNKIYDAKGTEGTFRLLFKTLFNIDINIIYPSEQILRASDGIWEIFNFVTLSRVTGEIPDIDNLVLDFVNPSGTFTVDVTRVENISNGIDRFYFSHRINLDISDHQIINIRNSVGNILYSGEVKKTVTSVNIIFPGKFWQVGQIIPITGSSKNTTVRVTRLTADSGVDKVEIIDHGYGDDDNLVTIVSPFPNRPFGNVVDTQANIVSYSPLVYHHVINITDYIEGISESIVGTSSDFGALNYFFDDYAEIGYSTAEVFRKTEIASGVQQTVTGPSSNVSIENWLLSRATLINSSSYVGKTRGKYKTDSGQLSNTNIRLQDNYYYQAFSYVIESTKSNSEYRGMIKISHPAGTKLFSNLIKQFFYTVDVIGTQSIVREDVVREYGISSNLVHGFVSNITT